MTGLKTESAGHECMALKRPKSWWKIDYDPFKFEMEDKYARVDRLDPVGNLVYCKI